MKVTNYHYWYAILSLPIDDVFVEKGCYRQEGCALHWKMRSRVPCGECGTPIAFAYGCVLGMLQKYRKKATIWTNYRIPFYVARRSLGRDESRAITCIFLNTRLLTEKPWSSLYLGRINSWTGFTKPDKWIIMSSVRCCIFYCVLREGVYMCKYYW